jgi:hypothetical protein
MNIVSSHLTTTGRATYRDTLPDIRNVLGYGLKVRRGVVTLGNKDIVVVT